MSQCSLAAFCVSPKEFLKSEKTRSEAAEDGCTSNTFLAQVGFQKTRGSNEGLISWATAWSRKEEAPALEQVLRKEKQ